MIKKRYLVVMSLAIVFVLLGSMLYNSVTFGGKPTPQPNQVEVTNFPLDGEGNLRVTQMNGEWNINIIPHTMSKSLAIKRSINGGDTDIYVEEVADYKEATIGCNCSDGSVVLSVYLVIGGVVVGYVYAVQLDSGDSHHHTFAVGYEMLKIHIRGSHTANSYSLGLYATD